MMQTPRKNFIYLIEALVSCLDFPNGSFKTNYRGACRLSLTSIGPAMHQELQIIPNFSGFSAGVCRNTR
jgi:hypothetical protein